VERAGVATARLVFRSGPLPLLALDAARTTLAFVAVLVLRFDGAVPDAHWARFGRFLPFVIAVELVCNWRFRLYEQVWRHASVDEAVRLLASGGVSLIVVLGADLFLRERVPVSVVVFGCMLATMATGASRFQSRLLASIQRGRRQAPTTPVAVLGDDEAAAALVRALRAEGATGLRPAAVLTDTPHDRGLSLLGVPIAGVFEDLEAIADEHGITYAVLAPTSSRAIVRRAADAADAAGVALKIVPELGRMLADGRILRTMRDVKIEDLLGREQVKTDLASVSSTIAERRVLITGAGGSIGGEIARQVAALRPASLVLVEHDETHLFETVAALGATAVTPVLADIRDAHVMSEIFERHKPEVVFHAAAHKHVPILEQHPREAVRTNVAGTRNVLRAAAAVGTGRLVFVSTDKAVDPSSVMGASKWLGEQLVALHAPPGSRWCSVRFGNVLGSRGSVIPTFTRQIESGGPVTVTDPTMTRYFMSTEEAVQLVLQAAALAEGTDVFMLEMGEPVRILDLAHKMIRLSGYVPDEDIKIVITGVRPGEKLEEQLSWTDEQVAPTAHHAIQQLTGPALDRGMLESSIDKLVHLADLSDDEATAELLREIPTQSMIDIPSRETGTWSQAST
jgi:FlaA1/EpsC-like NDP-sugar epimerase